MATQGYQSERGQTKSSLRTSDQHCRPSVWEGGWARRLPTAASVQNTNGRGKKTKKKHRRTPTQTQKPCREIPSRHTSTELIIPHSVTLYFGPTMPNMYRRTSPSHTEKPSWVLSDLSLSVAQIACNIFIFSSFTRFLSVCFSVYLKYPGG